MDTPKTVLIVVLVHMCHQTYVSITYKVDKNT